MNYCSNCGDKLNEGSIYCPNCGYKLLKEENNLVQEVDSEAKKQNKTNVFAIVGFVTTLLSVLSCGFTAPISLIFSIIGLINAKKFENNGKGFAIAGIVISTIFITLLVFSFIFIVITSNDSVNHGSYLNDSFDGPIY